MFEALKRRWIEALRDPSRAPSHALLITETKTPWGWRESLQPSALALATDAAAVTLIGPSVNESSNTTYRKLDPASQEVLIVEQFDYWYEEASQGDLTADINACKLKLLINGQLDRRLPEFALNRFARGDSVLKFGKLPLGWILPREATVALVCTPNGNSGGSMNVYCDLLIRREPLWLMEEAGLLEADKS